LRDGVGEVRFKVGGVNYRPLGSFVPGRNEFTFTLFATKTNRFDPRDAIDIAARRRIYIELHNSRSKVVKDRWGQ
jgi:hypothetical protein